LDKLERQVTPTIPLDSELGVAPEIAASIRARGRKGEKIQRRERCEKS
jgi:hypothetical protein